MPTLIVALLMLLLVGPAGALSARPESGSAAVIGGSITGFTEGSEEPLSEVRIELRPVAPLKGRDRRPAPDLLGLALSNGDGSFQVTELHSSSQRRAYPLLVGWTYEAKVIAPGHYIFHGIVNYFGGSDPWDFMLEARVTDVVDDSGTIAPDDRALQRGATRRGDQ